MIFVQHFVTIYFLIHILFLLSLSIVLVSKLKVVPKVVTHCSNNTSPIKKTNKSNTKTQTTLKQEHQK